VGRQGTVDIKQWEVDSGQWTVNSKQWAVNSGQWTMGRGQWALTEWPPSGIRSVRQWNLISQNFDFTKFDIFLLNPNFAKYQPI
jgi:hypothetical protein